MPFKHSGRNLLSVPMGISAGIHTLLIASLVFLSWEKTTTKPEIPPIKIANVFLEPEKTKPIQKINRENALAATQQETSKPEKGTTLKAPQPFQPTQRHTSNVSRKGPLPIKPSTPVSNNLNIDPQQPTVMISKPITPSPVPPNQRQKPRLIEFLPTEPALLTTKTVLRALSSSTHTAKSPRTPKLELGKAIALSPENISFHSGLSLSIPSPRDGVTARTITEEVFPGPLEASPGIQMMEREIPASKTSPIQIASIPSDFVDDRVENSAPSKSSHPDGETGSSGEDMDSIRKGFSSSVWGRIAKAKYYPPLARKQGWEGKPIVEFRLARNGDLLSSSIALSSPYKILNEAALGAVKNAVPYPKFPKALKLDSIRFKLPISFILSGP